MKPFPSTYSTLPSLGRIPSEAEALPIRTRIEKFSIPVPESGCWIWLGCGDRDGYGTLRFGGKRAFRAHRASWIAFCGPISDEQHVLHRCDTPPCVNPDHLFLGDPAINAADRKRKGRQPPVRASSRSGLRPRRARGFYYRPRQKRWIAQIFVGGRSKYLGLFVSAAEAEAVYLAALKTIQTTAEGGLL